MPGRLSRNQDVLNYGSQQASVVSPERSNGDSTVLPIIAFLADHKAETLDRVVKVSEAAEAAQASAGSAAPPERAALTS